jgi:hypothetical protein
MKPERIVYSECRRLEESRRFFNLGPQCALVKGALRGAIYDLGSGDVFSVDPVALRVLESCSLGREGEKVIAAAAPGSSADWGRSAPLPA